MADEHAPLIRKALDADGQFSEIHVGPYTGRGGCLLVEGTAPAGTTTHLKAIVTATSPPVPVEYFVDEITVSTQPAVE